MVIALIIALIITIVRAATKTYTYIAREFYYYQKNQKRLEKSKSKFERRSTLPIGESGFGTTGSIGSNVDRGDFTIDRSWELRTLIDGDFVGSEFGGCFGISRSGVNSKLGSSEISSLVLDLSIEMIVFSTDEIVDVVESMLKISGSLSSNVEWSWKLLDESK